MKFILAEKKEMTQKFAEDGRVIPVTRAVAGPCVVTQLKSQTKDSYSAVQIGFGKKNKISKSLKGHLKELGNLQYLREFNVSEEEASKLKVGDILKASVFQAGDIVKVTGTSKGKGFQGVVKRHGFHGSLKTHGHKDQVRMPGSIGCTGPAHVFKGTRMGGRMGGDQVTVSNLEIIEVNLENNEIFIKGAVPGPRNNLLLICGDGDLILEIPVDQELSNKQDKQDKTEEENSEIVEENVVEKETENAAEEPKVETPKEEIKTEEKEESKIESEPKEKEEPKVEEKQENKEVPTSAEGEVGIPTESVGKEKKDNK